MLFCVKITITTIYVKAFLIEGLFVLTQMVEDVFGRPRNTLILALFLINSSQRHTNWKTSACSICMALAHRNCRIRLKYYWKRHWTHSYWKIMSWDSLVPILWLSSTFHRTSMNVQLESLQSYDMVTNKSWMEMFWTFLIRFFIWVNLTFQWPWIKIRISCADSLSLCEQSFLFKAILMVLKIRHLTNCCQEMQKDFCWLFVVVVFSLNYF